MMNNQIIIFDTTLRDGEQSPGYSMNKSEKLRMALQLERLNVNVIEAGFPIASDGDFETVREVAKQIKTTTVAGLSRTGQGDIERAAKALEPAARSRIHTFIATSDIHMQYKLKKDRQEVLEAASSAVELARRYADEVEFSAEDASRSDPKFLFEIFEAVIDAGATIINVPDTVGYALPWEYGELIASIRDNVPNIDRAAISVHCHNDLGLAVANSLEAIRNGAQQVECTINGIGERAGNASLEEIVMAIHTRQSDFEQQTRINTEEIYASSRLLAEITGKDVQPNKAIVGENAFAHEAGIHQHGVLNNPLTYEIMTPESVGLPSNRIVLGKHSGRFALGRKLDNLGYELSREELNEIYIRFTKLADERKIVSDDDLIQLLKKSLPHKRVSGDSTVSSL
ncbi:MAG: 2-isopropylmalate synthase [Balneolaceae bacterium]